jgi:ATP-binding cassette subfamily F protein uup
MKPILSIKEGHLAFGDKVIFKDLDMDIYPKDKICLVGKNGEGKTTLMRTINSDIELDAGDFWLQPGTTVGYLPQTLDFSSSKTARDFISEGLPKAEEHEDNTYLIDIVCNALEIEQQAQLNTMSGGQVRRVSLAKALVSNPDILLLDEPTNHLDIDTIEWLENYLKFEYQGTLVCISHDRQFLKNVSNKTFWLDRGSLRINKSGYSTYDEWSIKILEQEQREIENMERRLREEKQWMLQGVTARRKRNQRRLREFYALREKIKDSQNKLRRAINKIQMGDLDAKYSSKNVVEVRSISKKYGDKTIFENVSYNIARGDRIGIIGKNGSGKTTFLQVMVKDLEPDSGSVKHGKTVQFTYFNQKRDELDPDDTLWETLAPNGADRVQVGDKIMHVVAYLKKFMFDPETIRSPVRLLSGGQANRLLLAKALANPGNILILDEPTNDLDMDTLDMLEDILMDYEGTLIVVSHDRDFLDRTITKTLAFEGAGKIFENVGGYSDYLALKEQEKLKEINEKAPKSNALSRAADVAQKREKPKKLSYKLVRELEMLPGEIEGIEKRMIEIQQQLEDPALYNTNRALFDEITHEYDNLVQLKENKEMRWLELEEMQAEL